MHFNTKAILSIVVCSLTACSSAPRSHEVSAAYVPVTRYDHLSCDLLIDEAESIRRNTPALEAAVNQHRSNQTGIEIITWVLFWPAAIALDKGVEYSIPLAQAKGELQAIQTSMNRKECGQQIKFAGEDSVSNQEVQSTESLPAKAKETEITTDTDSASYRLRSLEKLRSEGLINQDEYNEKRNEIVRSL